MNDPWWPGSAPPNRVAEGKPRIEPDVVPEQPASGLPTIWFPALGLLWLGQGPMVLDEVAHFGPGFAWLIALPFLTLTFAVAGIMQLFRHQTGAFGVRYRRWRFALWVFTPAVYLVAGAFVLMHD